MKRAMGRGAALVAAMVAVLTLLFVGSASAHGGGDWGPWPANDCDAGRASGDGAFIAATFKFTVCANHHDPYDVAGFFQAVGNFGTGAVISPRGPVTCADFKGNTVSFFYPFDAKSSPPPTPAVYGILIYAEDNGPKPGDDKVGFTMLPQAASADCTLGSPAALAAKAIAQPTTSGDIKVAGRKA